MPTINMPPIVNDQGNINVHIGEGCKIPITLQDINGNEQDASSLELYFIAGSFQKALDIDEIDPFGRVLILTPTDLTQIPHGSFFRIVERSDNSVSINRWEGRIYKRG